MERLELLGGYAPATDDGPMAVRSVHLVLKNHVERVDNSGDKSEQRKQYAQPKVAFESDFQKYTHWRQENSKEYFNRICCC